MYSSAILIDLLFSIVGTFCAHLSGKMYNQIIESQKSFTMQMNISGKVTGTGKSLFQSVWMLVFEGEEKIPVGSITEDKAYKALAAGNNIYGKCNMPSQ